MIVSIITSAYNVADCIQSTIDSLRNQSSSNFQWIIVDGGSVDGSLEIYRKNSDLIDFCISEPDTGIYEAWNKGLINVKGKWVLFLGAGDSLASEKLIELIDYELNRLDASVQFVFGDIYLVDKYFKKRISGNLNFGDWDLGLPKLPPHPGVFHRADLFNSKHKFDESYKIAGDSKFMLEHINKDNFVHKDFVVTDMITGGISSKPESWDVIRREKARIRKELKLSPPSVLNRIKDTKLYIKTILFFIFGPILIKIIYWIRLK